MKKIRVIAGICVILFTMVSASVWEGAVSTAMSGELPEEGLFIATNSYPVNTVVDITNLENGQTARMVVSSGLETPGLLALLSREAANAIGLPIRTLGRITMSQPTDTVALARFGDGGFSSGDPDHDPVASVAKAGFDPALWEKVENDAAQNIAAIGDDSSSFSDLPEPALPSIIADAEPAESSDGISVESRPQAVSPYDDGDYELSLVPTTPWFPADSSALDPSAFVPGIASVPQDQTPIDNQYDYYIDPSLFIDPVREPVAQAPLPEEQPYIPQEYFVGPNSVAIATTDGGTAHAVASSSGFAYASTDPAFAAPMIRELEKGMYYLQLGAFSKEDAVRSELSRIDNNLPLAIMNAGSNEMPVYRILIGPVNLGESGALLQRFKNNYQDAFVWFGR